VALERRDRRQEGPADRAGDLLGALGGRTPRGSSMGIFEVLLEDLGRPERGSAVGADGLRLVVLYVRHAGERRTCAILLSGEVFDRFRVPPSRSTLASGRGFDRPIRGPHDFVAIADLPRRQRPLRSTIPRDRPRRGTAATTSPAYLSRFDPVWSVSSSATGSLVREGCARGGFAREHGRTEPGAHSPG